MQVKIIAMPCSLAAAITSSSLIEPPGWMTALAPASAAASTPSRTDKNHQKPLPSRANQARESERAGPQFWRNPPGSSVPRGKDDGAGLHVSPNALPANQRSQLVSALPANEISLWKWQEYAVYS